jgi:hypothetical protein
MPTLRGLDPERPLDGRKTLTIKSIVDGESLKTFSARSPRNFDGTMPRNCSSTKKAAWR